MNHTFSNFIVGPSNRLARQAALLVADRPDATYNPLLIRASSGLGKTHLLHAVSDRAKHNQAVGRIDYLTPGSLGRALHDALQNGQVDMLRDQYMHAGILLVDDLHEIAGKRHTQKMLLTILDERVGSDRQVVMASRTLPQNLTALDPRLCSRLSGSAVVDIEPPEPETRRLVLRRKAAEHHVALSDDAVELIAGGAGASVRDLENCLARLAAYASLHERPIDDAMVRDMLFGKPPTDERRITAIQRTVASHFGVTVSQIRTRGRTRAVLVPRQIAMHLSHELTGASLSEIGGLFGGHSAASVQHAFRRIQQLAHRDDGIARALRLVRDALAQPRVENSDISFPQDGLKRMCG